MRPILSAQTARRTTASLMLALMGMAISIASSAQTGGTCIPVAERTTELGCFVHAEQHLEALPPGLAYWHIDRFPSH
ncbi:hypothetical protein LMG28727_06892 [Paraburkholderia kirstenboschensis]|nr:hypothetical protein LMG28727_06892 [Paraburkholderia kirstenboschensis]